tara:strand:- start:116 stop:391 length:276 start_codon:yes stop_codon:yes gene_type:complete
MGKLTLSEAETLEKEGIISKTSVSKMQEQGLISKRRRGTKRYMKTANGSWVSPQLYFQGLKGQEYSKKMTEFKNKFNELCQNYTSDKTNNK